MKNKILSLLLILGSVNPAWSQDQIEMMARREGWVRNDRPGYAQATPDRRGSTGAIHATFDDLRKEDQLSQTLERSFILPSYFMFPLSSMADVNGGAGYSMNYSAQANSAISGMVYNYNGTGIGLRMLLAPLAQDSRRDLSAELARSGAIRTGDILVSVRPGLANVSGYVNLQLLATHNSMALVRKDERGILRVYNVDMPASPEYLASAVNSGLYSTLDSRHFLEDDGFLSFHVLRPRITEQQRANIGFWLEQALENHKTYYPNNIAFNQDYMNPYWRQVGGNNASMKAGIKHVANSLLGRGRGKINIFCSEFTWMILALKNCRANNLDTCISPMFQPMSIFGDYFASGGRSDSESSFGMNDGLIMLAKTMFPRDSASQARYISRSIRTNAPAGALSQGHRDTDQQLKSMGFYDKAERYMLSVVQGRPDRALAAQINQMFSQNYSPTAFVSQAMIPEGFAQKKMDYIATVRFGREQKFLNLIDIIKSK